jgi:hypothetical protein
MKKNTLIIILLVAAITIAFALPKPKYASPDVLSRLNIPETFDSWRSRDISNKVNTGGDIYNFVSRVFARQYTRSTYYSLLDKDVEGLTFLILDAGNFHNPKVCYGSSGYTVKELPDIEFDANGRKFRASAVFFDKPGQGVIITYWIVIDKKQADWTQQKLIELWSSLFGRKKAGFMCRLDIPAAVNTTGDAEKLAKDFICAISPLIPADQAEYIFGK